MPYALVFIFFSLLISIGASNILYRNIRHNILIKEKPNNPINSKISIYPLNNITYIILR
jgi:hypothetical protein